jgi:hypothetical protein
MYFSSVTDQHNADNQLISCFQLSKPTVSILTLLALSPLLVAAIAPTSPRTSTALSPLLQVAVIHLAATHPRPISSAASAPGKPAPRLKLALATTHTPAVATMITAIVVCTMDAHCSSTAEDLVRSAGLGASRGWVAPIVSLIVLVGSDDAVSFTFSVFSEWEFDPITIVDGQLHLLCVPRLRQDIERVSRTRSMLHHTKELVFINASPMPAHSLRALIYPALGNKM